MKNLWVIAVVLVIIGAINWGLVGLGNFMGTNLNLVNLIFGGWPNLENIIYLLVGVCGLWKDWVCINKKCKM